MLLAICGCGDSSIEKAYNRITDDASKGNWDKVYDSFSTKSQGQLDENLKMLVDFLTVFSEEGDADTERIQNMSGKELFVDMFADVSADESPVLFGEVISKQVNGNSAIVRVRQNGKVEEFEMVKEGGKWKLHFEME